MAMQMNRQEADDSPNRREGADRNVLHPVREDVDIGIAEVIVGAYREECDTAAVIDKGEGRSDVDMQGIEQDMPDEGYQQPQKLPGEGQEIHVPLHHNKDCLEQHPRETCWQSEEQQTVSYDLTTNTSDCDGNVYSDPKSIELNQHESVHRMIESGICDEGEEDVDNVYQCQFCEASFEQKINWTRHKQECSNKNFHVHNVPEHHEYAVQNVLECQFCASVFETEDSLKEHLKSHNDESTSGQQTCEKDTTKKGKTQEMGEKKSLKWRFCLRSFGRRKKSCKRQEPLHLSDKSFKCKFCEKSFKTRYKYKAHVRKHATTAKASKNIDNSEIPIVPKNRKKDRNAQHKTLTEVAKKNFTCQFCQKSFGRRWDSCEKHELTHFRKTHGWKRSFKCYFCEKVFNTKNKCTLHEMEHGVTKCRHCEKSFDSLDDLKMHELTHTSKKVFRCGYCDKIFKQAVNRKRHEMTHTGEKPYKCSYCNKAFRLVHHRKKHEKKQHKGNSELTEDSLEEHNDGIPTVLQSCEMGPAEKDISQKTEEKKSFKCRFCLKSFGRREESCKRHELLHLSDTSFKCQICETLFKTKYKFEAHMRKHGSSDSASENVDTTVLECHLCNTCFVTKDSLKEHLKCHADEMLTVPQNRKKGTNSQDKTPTEVKKKNFTCRFCLKSFGRRWDSCEKHELTHFRKTHGWKRTFKCYFCEKVFNTKNKCTLHEMEHGETKCRHCEMSFDSLDDLKMHELTHTNVKLLRCGYCDKIFTDVGNRRRHEMTHTGEKPYKCSYCSKAFRLVHHRKKHEKKQHKGNSELTEDSLEEQNDGIPTVLQSCEMGPAEKDISQKTEEKKSFKCRFCLKSFGRREESCKRHELLHLSDTSFKCQICETLFKTKYKFEVHMRRHDSSAGENVDTSVLECEVCNTFFVTEDHLKEHLKCHTQEMPTEH